MDDKQYQEFRQNLLKRNSQWAKPDWKITTFKSDKEEEDFEKWVKKNKIPFSSKDPFPDYDMRGFYKALKEGKVVPEVNKFDNRLHFPDTFKTPYALTFSRDSQYATKDAPYWKDDRFLLSPSGQIMFDQANPPKGLPY